MELNTQDNISPVLNQKGFIPLILGVAIFLMVVAAGVYYLGTQKPRPNQSFVQTIPPTPMPQAQTGESCKTNDKEFCVLLESVKSLVNTENFSTLVTYQNPMEVVCDDKARAAQGLPTFRSDNLCKGIPEGDKTKGYDIGYNMSEGSTMTAQEYANTLKTYFTKKKPFNFVGSIVKDDKAYIVYTNVNSHDLFALPVKKSGTEWKLEGITLGVVSTDFTSLDPVILGYIK